jgi:hypothetical protein
MKQALIELVQRHVKKMRNRDSALEKEQKELEQRLRQIKEERSSLVNTDARYQSYMADIDSRREFRDCPICWINNGGSFQFTPISGDDDFDKFKCSHCGYPLDVPA